MGLLDFDESKITRYKPPAYRQSLGAEQEEKTLGDLNNLDRSEVTKDFSDSPHLNK